MGERTLVITANVEKVKGWIDALTPAQEIHCDYYPQPNNDDPHCPSWALEDIDGRRVLDFIDQSGPDENDHCAIADVMDEAEKAGRVVKIACGFYRHPQRPAENRTDWSAIDPEDIPF